MAEHTSWAERVSHALHRRFLPLLLASYAAASLWPAAGQWLAGTCLAEAAVWGVPGKVTPPALLLALLLFNAGLGVRGRHLRQSARRPGILLAGLTAAAAVPLGLVFAAALGMRLWHNSEEAQTLLVGLGVVAAMPVAGSSAGWARNADGDMALSLGMVLLSTLLSPLSTPAALQAIRPLASGALAEGLDQLAEQGAVAYLLGSVALPAALGMAAAQALGEERCRAAGPLVKAANAAAVLALCYTNASVCLPQVVADPDWDFLAVTVGAAAVLSWLGFAAGHLLALWLQAPRPQRASLMFGLGMSNNGTGLVLAAATFTGQPMVLLPILCYNLVQHLVAGAVHGLLRPQEAGHAAQG